MRRWLCLLFLLPGWSGAETTFVIPNQDVVRLNETEKGANKVWLAFIGCAKLQKNEAELDRCLTQNLFSKLNTYERNKNFEFLTHGFEVTELFPCSAQVLKKLQIPGQKENILCFKIHGEKSLRIGSVHFKMEVGERLSIYRVRY